MEKEGRKRREDKKIEGKRREEKRGEKGEKGRRGMLQNHAQVPA